MTQEDIEIALKIKKWAEDRDLGLSDMYIGHLIYFISGLRDEWIKNGGIQAVEDFVAFLEAPGTVATSLEANKELFIKKLKGEKLPY